MKKQLACQHFDEDDEIQRPVSVRLVQPNFAKKEYLNYTVKKKCKVAKNCILTKALSVHCTKKRSNLQNQIF